MLRDGVTAVVMASLYKPIVEYNEEKISSIIKTSKVFYKKIGIIFIIYSVCLSIVYPLIVQGEFSYTYVLLLVIFSSISLLIQYLFSLTYKNLLNASKKGYIVSLTQTLILFLTIAMTYISVIIYPSIHILKLISGMLFILQPIIYKISIDKSYKIDKNAKEDKKLLEQRWNGFAINIAAFIHNGTDVTILTIFTDLATVSIYSVYAIVTNGLRAIINAVSNAIVPTIGLTYAKSNEKDLNEKLDIYEYIIFILVFFMFTLAGLLITPFVMIYTNNITDANYNQLLFGILIVISEAIYLIKFPHLNLAYSSNKFKELTKPAFTEAIINIFISIVLVYKMGLIGVTIGTIIAMLYRMITQVNFTNKLIKTRKISIFYKKLLIFIISTIIGLVGCSIFIPLAQFDIMSWISHAILYAIIFGIIYLIISLLFFKKEVLFLKKYLMHR